jgi:MutS domain V
MKAEPLCDAPTAQALACHWLVEAVRPAGAYGDRLFETLRPYAPGRERDAQARAARIARIAASVDRARLDAVRDVLRGTPDVAATIARASMGDVLGDPSFLELLRFGDALESIDESARAILGRSVLAGGVVATRRALEAGRSGKFGFYLSDAFDGRLASARAELSGEQAALDAARGRAAAAAGSRLGRDDLGDEFIVMRDDVRGPLPPGVRVLREAPTYFLCALDYDPETLAALERRDAAAARLAAVEEDARARLSAVVAGNAAPLDAAASALGEIDVLAAAARFAAQYGCCVAEIGERPHLSFEGGRFLPLAVELEAEGRTFVPIDVDLHDVAVLTGPNMGGKSVCLQTCGFVALCAAFGLPVPARSAHASLFESIAWLGIGGDEERLGGLLSSFAKEVVRLRDVLERRAARLFVLIDEFARTTTPPEAKALLIALLERLREEGACGLAATHLAGVAREAGVRHFAVRGLRGIPQPPPAHDLHAALAALAASMDYSIAAVGDDDGVGADALALAALLGLDARLVDDAYGHLK